MKPPNSKKIGCFGWGGIILLIIILLQMILSWYHTRPNQLLHRFLGVEMSPSITRIETDYTGGKDYTALIYIEGDPQVLRAVAYEQGFRSLSGIGDSNKNKLLFGDIPSINEFQVKEYQRHVGTVLKYLVISEDGRRLWFGAFDY